jgi:hypothetical protein
MPKTYDLAAIIKAEKDANPGLVIKAGVKEFTLPPSPLWPDAVYEVPNIDGAKILLGDQYDAFCEAGGTAALLFRIYAIHNGASLPESEASTDS